MKITLPQTKQVVTRPAEVKEISELTIVQIIDHPSVKKVVCATREAGNHILWEGEAYDAIGQWTDEDVQSRLQEIFA